MIRVATALLGTVAVLGGLAWFAGWGFAPQAAQAQSNVSEPTMQEIDEVRGRIQRQANLMRQVEGIVSPTAFREPQVNETAAMALGRIGFAAVQPLAIELQRSNDPNVRYQITSALAFIGPEAEAAVPQLIEALQDESVVVRRGAARALGQIGPGAYPAIPELIQALRDNSYSDAPAE